jgi:hypothetical protein
MPVRLVRNRRAAQPIVTRKGAVVVEALILAFMSTPLRPDHLALAQNRLNALGQNVPCLKLFC